MHCTKAKNRNGGGGQIIFDRLQEQLLCNLIAFGPFTKNKQNKNYFLSPGLSATNTG